MTMLRGLSMALALLGATHALAQPEPVTPPPNTEVFGLADELVLDFPPSLQERRTLPDGGSYYLLSGTIRNAGTIRRAVPELRVVFRNGAHQIVYEVMLAPAKRTLAPGESIDVNEALMDIPRSAKYREIGWKLAD